MERRGLQLSVAGMLGLVACLALNFWLFRLGTLLGLIGLNITKHVVIAYVCQVAGVDKRRPPSPVPGAPEVSEAHHSGAHREPLSQHDRAVQRKAEGRTP